MDFSEGIVRKNFKHGAGAFVCSYGLRRVQEAVRGVAQGGFADLGLYDRRAGWLGWLANGKWMMANLLRNEAEVAEALTSEDCVGTAEGRRAGAGAGTLDSKHTQQAAAAAAADDDGRRRANGMDGNRRREGFRRGVLARSSTGQSLRGRPSHSVGINHRPATVRVPNLSQPIVVPVMSTR